MGVDLHELSSLLQRGMAKDVKELTLQAIEEGLSAEEILNNGLLSGMGIIGEKFKKNEVFVPEVLIAARAMSAGMEVLKPQLAASNVEEKGTVVIGTVKGDLHDIGKNLVSMMMKGKGLCVIDLGTDVPAERFISEAEKNKAQIIACSALLTTTMKEMAHIVTAVKSSGLKVKVFIGGAPVTDSYRETIGADGYAPDASSAADIAYEVCTKV